MVGFFGRADFSQIFIFGLPDFSRILSPDFFSFLWEKVPRKNLPGKFLAKSSKIYTPKIPDTILQMGPGQHIPKNGGGNFRGRHGGVEKEGEETLMKDTPPRKGVLDPPSSGMFSTPSGVVALFFSCTEIQDPAHQKLFWRGPKPYHGPRNNFQKYYILFCWSAPDRYSLLKYIIVSVWAWSKRITHVGLGGINFHKNAQ